MDNIISKLSWRYATKIFKVGTQVSPEARTTILEAGRMAPTAYGLQPFRIIHVTNPEIRAKLRTEAAFNQAQVTDAGDLFIIARRTDIDEAFVDAYVAHIASVRSMNVADLAGFASMMKGDILARSEEGKATWAGRQAYIALGMMLQTAALLEVDSCPMEGFDPSKVDDILDLKSHNAASLGLFALGYRGEGDIYATLPKVRQEMTDLVVTA
jgi:nitroreductase